MLEDVSIWNLVMQGGFAGLCVVLLGIVVWLIKQLLKVLEQNNAVITANTHAILDINNLQTEHKRLLTNIHDTLLQRPCVLERGMFKKD